jgi:hypothetical protein
MSRVKHDDEADPADFARGVLGRDVPLLAGIAEPDPLIHVNELSRDLTASGY